mgnify:CR=1 FL=1
MATVSNVQLQIEKGGEGNRREVRVSYTLCFTTCEARGGLVFVERVILRGDDPIWDNNLTTLRNRCIQAQRGCVDRSVTQLVSRNTLDEDGDTIILGVPIFADRDELYARVTIRPYEPSGGVGHSNIVTGQFGAAGGD